MHPRRAARAGVAPIGQRRPRAALYTARCTLFAALCSLGFVRRALHHSHEMVPPAALQPRVRRPAPRARARAPRLSPRRRSTAARGGLPGHQRLREIPRRGTRETPRGRRVRLVRGGEVPWAPQRPCAAASCARRARRARGRRASCSAMCSYSSRLRASSTCMRPAHARGMTSLARGRGATSRASDTRSGRDWRAAARLPRAPSHTARRAGSARGEGRGVST